MPKLSVLIPSRNERYLFPTIRDCFAKAEGEVEVVVTLDGYWPEGWKEITDKFPNLHTVHHGEPRGLRAAVNAAAASAISRRTKYLLKLDAHCTLDEGYDTKLQADMEPNWIVVPRRKRLDAEHWTIQDVGKPDIDYHYLSFPDDPNDFGGKGLNGKVWYERITERLSNPDYEIDDEMSSQGSAYFLAADYFQQLELMDERSYGPFWNEFQECGLKCWLSGGQVKINKKTWYAHLHKGRDYKGEDGKSGRGYHLPESWLQQGATFTKNWMYNDAWAKQTKPFKWLIEHFWPVPTWPDDWEERLYATRKPRLVGADYSAVGNTGNDIGSAAGVSAGADVSLTDLPEATAGSVRADDYNGVGRLIIHYAFYGDGSGYADKSVDVTQRVRELVKDDSLDIVVNNATLTPGQNPFRGKKKKLKLAYSYATANGDGEQVVVTRDEKDWLIIGQMQQPKPAPIMADSHESTVARAEAGISITPAAQGVPMSAVALNDYLIRKFSISPQRLRGPMPIELRDFHRNDLAQLFAELGFKRGAEIGVAEGNYSEVLLKANPECELLLVDPWHAYSDNPQNKSKEKHELAYTETLRKIAPYRGATTAMKTSMDAVREIADKLPNHLLDFCYIDGNHLFDYVIQDLIEWSKRVRSGGIVSGDDWYQLDQKRWVGGGVVEAVQVYTNAHRIPVWYVFAGHKSVDFMWVKP
jgi:hypothetical protein